MHIFSNTCTHHQQQQLKAMRKSKAGAWEGLCGGQRRGKLCIYNFKNKKYTHKKEADNWNLDVPHKEQRVGAKDTF